MNDIDKPKKQLDFKFTILIFQTAVFILAILIMLVIKTAFSGFYKVVRAEYIKYFEQRTDVDDILKPNEGIESFEEGYKVYRE